jgi:hypothetical protein
MAASEPGREMSHQSRFKALLYHIFPRHRPRFKICLQLRPRGRAHKYRVENGAEITGGGWPQAATLKPYNEKGSSALSIATARTGTSYLYITNSGYLGDRGDYQGHLTAVNLADGSQKVFNSLCSNLPVHFVDRHRKPDCPAVRSGIWGRAGVVYSSKTDRIYMTTGNAPFEPQRYLWGDTVLALNPDGTGRDGEPLDSFTPSDFNRLEEEDLDLGSTAPVILQGNPGARSNLAIQSGKDGKLRLIDLENLSGRGGPGHVGGEKVFNLPQGGEVLSAPAAWVDPEDGSSWIFIANRGGISAMKLTVEEAGSPMLREVWRESAGGTSPLLANGVLFLAGSGMIRALDPATGKLLWKDAGIGGIHWESPVVVNGVLYITDEAAMLHAYALKGPPTR